MSFINSLSTGGKGIKGQRGPTSLTCDRGPIGLTGESGDPGETGLTGDPGPRGIAGSVGNTGPQGPQGTNAGPDPEFVSIDCTTLNCTTFKNNGYKILQSTFIQLNNGWRDITGIGNRFAGIVVLTSESDNLSCGTFVVSNTSSSQAGSVTPLSVQGDDSDSSKKVALGYVDGVLKATKTNQGLYQNYRVSCFGFH